MNESNRPLKVFLCHAHADHDAVKALYTRLTNDGVDAWLDKEKLLPGQDWELEIRKAVREADVVVVCLSKQFNQAGFRQKEVRLALDTAMEKPEGEIFIIPARLEVCDTLESLRKWHWVDLFEDDGYERLTRALRARANRIGSTLQIKQRRVPDIFRRGQKAESPQNTSLDKPIEQSQNVEILLTPLAREKGQYASLKLHNNNLEETVYCRVVPKKITWLKEDPKAEPQWVDITDEINLERFPFSWHLGSTNSEEEILPDGDGIVNLAKFESSGNFAGRTTFTFFDREPSHLSGKFRIDIDILCRLSKTSPVIKKSIAICLDVVDSSRKDVVYELKVWECKDDQVWIEKQAKESAIKEKTGSEVAEKNIPKERAKKIISGLLDIKYLSVFIALIVLFFGNNIYEQITGHSVFATEPVPSVTSTATFTLTPKPITPSQTLEIIQPSKIPTITFTPTESFTPTATPLPTEITDTKGVQMILVPAGEFTMGSNNGIPDVKPVHQVYLDSFYIDKYEVTNALYRICVDDGVCSPPKELNSYTRSDYYRNPEFANYPVIYVDWDRANKYCSWRQMELPTEAQWEKAARGVDGRTYPWGEGINCSRANYCVGDTTEVGSYNNGISPYGIYDMAGNVREWVADWYSATYYEISDIKNPLGPKSGKERILRGGTWGSDEFNLQTSTRNHINPNSIFGYDFGFRCTKDVNP